MKAEVRKDGHIYLLRMSKVSHFFFFGLYNDYDLVLGFY